MITIDEVANKTDLSPVNIRKYELSYKIVTPTRNEEGHRFYTLEDIETLLQFAEYLKQGKTEQEAHSLMTFNDFVASEQDKRIISLIKAVKARKFEETNLLVKHLFTDSKEEALNTILAVSLALNPAPDSCIWESIINESLHEIIQHYTFNLEGKEAQRVWLQPNSPQESSSFLLLSAIKLLQTGQLPMIISTPVLDANLLIQQIKDANCHALATVGCGHSFNETFWEIWQEAYSTIGFTAFLTKADQKVSDLSIVNLESLFSQ